jgi:Protein of unknown function (DUF2946)
MGALSTNRPTAEVKARGPASGAVGRPVSCVGRDRSWLRIVLAVLAMLQALAPGVASVADARPEAAALSRHIAPHVEQFGAKHPWRSHLDNCVLCQIAARHFTPTHRAPIIAGTSARALPPADVGASAPTAGRWAAPNSRAPPAI